MHIFNRWDDKITGTRLFNNTPSGGFLLFIVLPEKFRPYGDFLPASFRRERLFRREDLYRDNDTRFSSHVLECRAVNED